MEPPTKKVKKGNEDQTDNSKNDSLRENEVRYGLLKFISNHGKRFKGIIKQRYSDFMVREIDVKGELVLLNNLRHIDDLFEDKEVDEMECPIKDKEELEKILMFSESENKEATFTLEADDDKEHRKLVHKYIKDKYKNVETDTITLDNQSRAIRLSFKKSKNQNRRSTHLKNCPRFCHFTLFKQNKDTMEAVNLISKLLHCNSSFFGYAGTKDRRATTIQRVSVKRKTSKEIVGLNKRLNNQNMYLGNCCYSEEPLKLGDSTGNEFIIIIRNIKGDKDDINVACESLAEKGFINYFGLQRFGTGGVPTHEIGKSLLNGNFEEAVNLILKPREDEKNEKHSQHAAKKIWTETKDSQAALRTCTNKHSIEFKLLSSLSKDEKNYINALQALPRNTRLLYVHSFQSYVWNNAASERIEKYGLAPCVGDLVLKDDPDEKGKQIVKLLEQSDIDEEKYTISAIVLPQPGFEMVYPDNSIKDFYKELLTANGMDINDLRRKQKDFSLPGKYRALIVKPKNLSWEIIQYDDYTVSLIENDVQLMQNAGTNEKKTEITGNSVCNKGKYMALKLTLTLPASSYATSALRELLTDESSYQSQNALNKEFENQNNSKEILVSSDEAIISFKNENISS